MASCKCKKGEISQEMEHNVKNCAQNIIKSGKNDNFAKFGNKLKAGDNEAKETSKSQNVKFLKFFQPRASYWGASSGFRLLAKSLHGQ